MLITLITVPFRRDAPTGGTLNLAGYIQLDHQVNDIQSCDFLTSAALICASDDSSETLFSNAKPLVEITLPGPLTGQSTTGHVIDLARFRRAASAPAASRPDRAGCHTPWQHPAPVR